MCFWLFLRICVPLTNRNTVVCSPDSWQTIRVLASHRWSFRRIFQPPALQGAVQAVAQGAAQGAVQSVVRNAVAKFGKGAGCCARCCAGCCTRCLLAQAESSEVSATDSHGWKKRLWNLTIWVYAGVILVCWRCGCMCKLINGNMK